MLRSKVAEPGPHVTCLQVMFTPSPAHDTHYAQRLPIRVNYNNKGPVIACAASSFTPKLTFEKPQVDLGPILPKSGTPNEAVLRLCNNSDIAIEVRLTLIALWAF